MVDLRVTRMSNDHTPTSAAKGNLVKKHLSNMNASILYKFKNNKVAGTWLLFYFRKASLTISSISLNNSQLITEVNQYNFFLQFNRFY